MLAVAGSASVAAQDPLPGKGLAQHDFFYAGEAQEEQMFIVRKGEITWSYTHPAKGEISDAVMLSNGHILFAHQYGVTEITTNKMVVWDYEAPKGTEIHTAQPIGNDRVVLIQNGNPAKLMVINKKSQQVEREFVLPVGNPNGTHGQFRHARLTDAGTILVAHMDMGKACEYDSNGKELRSWDVPGIWSAIMLKNGNILTVGRDVREFAPKGDIVWKFTPGADAPEYKLSNLQLAVRLPNGNTIINGWFNQWNGKKSPSDSPLQAIEVTQEKKVVWALSSWTAPADLGPSTTIQLLDEPAALENVHFGEIK